MGVGGGKNLKLVWFEKYHLKTHLKLQRKCLSLFCAFQANKSPAEFFHPDSRGNPRGYFEIEIWFILKIINQKHTQHLKESVNQYFNCLKKTNSNIGFSPHRIF